MQYTAYILRSNTFMQYTAYFNQEDISWINIIHLYLLLSLKFPDSPILFRALWIWEWRISLTRQSTKQLVDKLVEKGYVTLEKSDADKRNMIIVITDKGRRWGTDNMDKNMRFVSELYADISERDIKTFAKVQQKLLNKLYVMKEELSNDTNRE